jgi:hypothetical protein
MSSGPDCPCGCADIGLKVDPSLAPQARLDLPSPLVTTATGDVASVHAREPLSFYEEDNWDWDPAVRPTANDLNGAIGLILWVEQGWLSSIEVWAAGDFRDPRTFPPAELFEPPEFDRSGVSG